MPANGWGEVLLGYDSARLPNQPAVRIVSYGSSLACNAASFGSPADSMSPVALRSPLARTLPFSWCGRFPAGWYSSAFRAWVEIL